MAQVAMPTIESRRTGRESLHQRLHIPRVLPTPEPHPLFHVQRCYLCKLQSFTIAIYMECRNLNFGEGKCHKGAFRSEMSQMKDAIGMSSDIPGLRAGKI